MLATTDLERRPYLATREVDGLSASLRLGSCQSLDFPDWDGRVAVSSLDWFDDPTPDKDV